MQAILQPILQFLKKHYEKIVLCVVLMGLAAAAIWMGSFINRVKTDVDVNVTAPPRGGKGLEPLDLTTDLLALAAVTNPPPVVLSGEHNLFNPVTWRRMPNGQLRKFLKIGPDALRVLGVTPLYTVISFDRSSTGGVYVLGIQQHSVKKAPEYATVGQKKKLYTIRGIKGATENPDALELDIADTGETVTITQDKPFKEVDGYTADLRYDPESKEFKKERVDDTIELDGEQYKIVEITNNLVRVQSQQNTKVTPIPFNGSP